jgi:3-hydroxyisobutyrate dehydrogenase-like beta-hydroxyacid dehydrogenase
VKTLAILHPGDMGSAVAKAFTSRGWRVVSYLAGRSERTRRLALEAGVIALPSIADCLSASELVISLVPQRAATTTAAAFGAACRRVGSAPPYVDANSLSPVTMAEVARIVTENGAACVDGAFIGNAAMLSTKTTLYLSGPAASSVSEQIDGALATRVLGPDIGSASSFKLSIYGFNKGLVAMFLEMVTAADLLGCREELLGCLRDFYPEQVATVERLLPTYPHHVGRRIQEMDEVIAWLASIGHRSDMAVGTRSVFGCLEALALDDRPWTVEQLVEECCRRRLLSGEERDSGSV